MTPVPQTWKVNLGYRLGRVYSGGEILPPEVRKAEILVTAYSPRDAFDVAKRELLHRLIDEAISAANSAWNQDEERR